MLDVVCVHCGNTLKIPEQYLGQRGKCNHCHGEIIVGAPAPEFPADLFGAEVVEPGEDEKEELSAFLQGPLVESKPRAFFRRRRILWVCVLLAALLASAVLVGWLVRAKTRSMERFRAAEEFLERAKQRTVTSLAEASRRLESRGYRYVERADSALCTEIISYERQVDDALFTAVIERWSGYEPLVDLCFCVHVRERTFNSLERLLRLYKELDDDACAVINGRHDYQRAVAGMREVKDDNGRLLRHEGQVTTSEGWHITTIMYDQFYPIGEHIGPVTERDPRIALIEVVNLENEENIPLPVSLEFNRKLAKAKEEFKRKYDSGADGEDTTQLSPSAPVPETTGLSTLHKQARQLVREHW